MAKNEWVDGGRYYVESDGKMARDKWVDGGRHYVDYDGVRQPKLDGKQYNAALNKAKSYNSVLHMSKKDLYNQLTWNGFSSSAAQYAIDHLNADYKANALITAREYRKNNHLSKTEIYEWLTSSYVGKFTKEEANYAIQKLNLPSEGSQARNKWVGNYYFKSDGKMAKNEWVDGGRYYVDSEGKMVRGKWVDGGRYYVESDGKMARDKWVDGGRHYVDYDGVRQPKLDGKQYNAALNKAKSYNSVLHMSKKDLYNQLTWNGFSSSAAQYAIDHLNADYKANALITAREYRKNNHLSKTEIYEWLTSSYVGKFTKEEANYAIQHLGD